MESEAVTRPIYEAQASILGCFLDQLFRGTGKGLLMKDSERKALLLWFYDVVFKARSDGISRFYAQRYGHAARLRYVCGYPKSGTTWVSHMVAHYLDLPVIRASSPSLGVEGVIHQHWDYHPSRDHAIYVIRDGRDVMVSIYMNLMKAWHLRRPMLADLGKFSLGGFLHRNVGHLGAREHRFERLLGRGFDPWDVERNLPRFIEAELQKPFIAAVTQPWPQHVASWRAKAEKTTFIKYEDMLSGGVTALCSALASYLQTEIDSQEAAYTFRRYSFQRQSGRNAGDEDRTSFARKGIAGDWKNHFSQEARQVFDHYAGDLLIELEYEPDRKWVGDVVSSQKN